MDIGESLLPCTSPMPKLHYIHTRIVTYESQTLNLNNKVKEKIKLINFTQEFYGQT